MSGAVLVTGGAGFIGVHLAAALVRDGFELDIVDNLSRGADDAALQSLVKSGRVRFHNVDTLEPGALDQFGDHYQFIVHLAAILGVQNVVERPYRTLRHNWLLHEAAIAFAGRQKRLQRFLFTSTSEVYAGSVLHLSPPFPTPEDTLLALPAISEPRTSYMLSKIYGEAMLTHSGIPYTIVRPHNVYGPRMGMAHVIPQLLEKADSARKEGSLEVFSPDHKRTFCFIADAVEMMKRLLLNPAGVNQVVNLGTENPEFTMLQVAHIVIDAVGKNIVINEGPATPGSPLRRTPDMTRMTNLTGYIAQTKFEDGVRQTYEWYKRNVFERACG